MVFSTFRAIQSFLIMKYFFIPKRNPVTLYFPSNPPSRNPNTFASSIDLPID